MEKGYAIAAALVAAIAVFGGGYRAGQVHTDNAWQAKDAKRIKADANKLASEMLRGEKASGALQAELQELHANNDQLTKAFNDYKRRNPIVAFRPARAASQATVVGQTDPAQPAQPAPVQPGALPAGDVVGLTLGGVWMWNSALFQRDTPAGACGLADATEGACAPLTDLTIEDAWDNHALNAKLCAEDRVRHQRLIDFIKGRKQ